MQANLYSKIRQLLALSTQEKVIFFEALFLLHFYALLLKCVDLKRIFRPAVVGSNKKHQKLSELTPQRIARLLNSASKAFSTFTCLPKALVGYKLLCRQGFPVHFHIGVKKGKGQELEAHAWLSLDGEVIIGNLPDLSEFSELPLEQLKEG
jgi:hypothetical protein